MVVSAVVGGALALGFCLPLAWKWELGVRRVGIAVTLIAVFSGVVVALIDSAADGFPFMLRAFFVAALRRRHPRLPLLPRSRAPGACG